MSQQTILVIEDTYDIREEVETILKLEGFQTLTAGSGEEGLQIAFKNPPDMIICDIMMPGMDGYDVFHALQEKTGFEAIPFIFLTAKTTRADLRAGMEIGADDYLTKPFQASELLSAVRSRLERHDKLKSPLTKTLNEIRDSFAWSLPEGLIAPLNGIIGMADLMSDGRVNGEKVKDMAKMIKNSGETLRRRLERFMLFADIQVWRVQPEKVREMRSARTENADKVLNASALRIARNYGRAADIDLRVTPAKIKIDAFYLEKIQEEILGKAFDSTMPGTPVRFHTVTDLRKKLFTLTVSYHANVKPSVELKPSPEGGKKFSDEDDSINIVGALVELHEGKAFGKRDASNEYMITIELPISGEG